VVDHTLTLVEGSLVLGLLIQKMVIGVPHPGLVVLKLVLIPCEVVDEVSVPADGVLHREVL